MNDPHSILPVNRVSLVDLVVERIEAFIQQSNLKPSDRLPSESEWSKRLGVSRPIVREAVRRLRALGVLTVSAGRGRGITLGNINAVLQGVEAMRAALVISPQDLREFVEFRTALEVYTARRAAEIVAEDDLAILEIMCDQMDELGTTHEETVRRDYRFHLKIAEIVGNQVILNTLKVSQEIMLQVIRELRQRNVGRKVNSRIIHLRIVNALRRRDPDAAQIEMMKHTKAALNFFDAAAKKAEDNPRTRPPKSRSRRP